jgi:TonB-dependent SusC/RagA subfamily outer membrane receptor
MKIRIFLFVFLALTSAAGLYGQKSKSKVTITGFVSDVNATPVPDAIIMIDGEKTDNLTNRNGFYKIKIRNENLKIGVYTAIGGILEEEIAGRKNIDFTYKVAVPYMKTNPANDPVDQGYGKTRKKDLAGPVDKIDATRSKYAGYNNIYELIRGQFSGVVVNGKTIIIRSISTLTEDTEPLFVVDGAPVTSIDNIEPQMVKSIEILKGSSASIYGVRGSNGVILINLLKGNDR